MTRLSTVLILAGLAACGRPDDSGAPANYESAAVGSLEATSSSDEVLDRAESDLQGEDLASPGDDLDRFLGVYGDPAAQERMPRNVFLDRACDGRLLFGAMWGDVAPWAMERVSETRFEQAVLQPYETEPIRLEFHLDADGRVEGLTHTLGRETRVRRLRNLPVEFGKRECPP